MLPAISPAVLKGNAQEAYKILNKSVDVLQVVPARTKKHYIFMSRSVGDAYNLHFDVYNKAGQMTERFELSSCDENAVITKYQSFKTKVMRSRDPLLSRNSDMTFEQKLQARPIIVKRIETLLDNAVKSIVH